MQKLIGLLLLAMVAHAQTTDLPQKIDRANRKVKQLTGPGSTCTTCGFSEGKDIAPNAWRECFKNVCGHKLNAYEIQVSKILSTPAATHPAFAKLSPLVESAFKSEVEATAAVTRRVLKILDETKDWNDPIAKALGAQMTAISRINKVALTSSGEIDESKTAEILTSVKTPAAEIEMTVALTKKILKLTNASDYAIFSDDFEYVRQGMDDQEIKKELKKVLGRLDELELKFSSITGLPSAMAFSSSSDKSRKARLLDGTYSANDIEELRSNWISGEIAMALATDKELLNVAEKINFNPNSPENREILNQNLKQAEDYLAGRNTFDALSVSASGIIASYSCFSTVAMAFAQLPTETEVKRYVKFEEPNLRKKYLKKLSAYLSPRSSGEIEKNVNTWKLKAPESSEALMARLKRSMEALKADNAEVVAEINKPMSPALRQRVAAIYIPTARDYVLAEDLNELCTASRPQPLADYAIRNEGKFSVGSRTVLGGAEADFVLNHEYSHLISGLLQNNQGVSENTKRWHSAVRNCLAQGHADKSDHRTEEDFADLLAASFAGGSRLFCEFIPDNETNFTMKNWNPEDKTHSGHFYRVLHARVLTGEGVPEICRAALAEKGEAPFERNCLKETPEAGVR